MASKILVLNGPNLNLLGTREPERYGSVTLEAIERDLGDRAVQAGAEIACYQSNSESDLVERIQRSAAEGVEFIIINPAAYTHTSVAIRDALAAVRIPFIEVHLSNIHAREEFRHKTMVAPVATGMICGFGPIGYTLAIQALAARL